MTQTVLLDLGNVILGVDFRRVFRHWADAAGIAPDRFYERWQMDAHYAAHETGDLSFEGYTAHLSQLFEVTLSPEDWERGWNAIWTEPFHDVIALLPALAERGPLYGFSNTNNTHTDHWSTAHETALAPIQEIFVSSHIGLRKPNVSAYHYVCEQMEAKPADVLFLDDSQENINGALRAGLDARLVRSEAEVVAQLETLL